MPKPALKGNLQAVFMLAGYTILWAILMLVLGFGPNPFSMIGLVLFLVYSVWLFIEACRTMHAVQALPDVEKDGHEQKRFNKRFGMANMVQIILIIVSVVILGAGMIGNYTYIMPVIALIVGVHFFVLGALFHSRIQAVLGTPIVTVAIISIIVIALEQFINPMIGICCLVTALCTAAMGAWLLRLVRVLLKEHPSKYIA